MICEPTRTKWWGTGRRSPRVEDWLQIPLRGKWHVDSGAVGVGEGTRAARRAVCQGSRDGSREKNKPHHRRGSCRRRSTNPSSLADGAQLAQKRKRKGRFGVGAGLRGQVPDRPLILRGSVGPSKAPLAYRPTSSRPSQQGHRSVSDRVPTLRGVEPVGMRSGVPDGLEYGGLIEHGYN